MESESDAIGASSGNPDEAGNHDSTDILDEEAKVLAKEISEWAAIQGATKPGATNPGATNLGATKSGATDPSATDPSPTSLQSPPLSDYVIDVDNDEEHFKYEAWINEEVVANLDYRLDDEKIVLISTSVKYAYRRHGIATELIAKTLNDIRTTGRKIIVICPVVRAFIEQYPQYEDLLAVVPAKVESKHVSQEPTQAMSSALDDQVTAFETTLDDEIEPNT
jgi:predicted GNAT family acetyltransferase